MTTHPRSSDRPSALTRADGTTEAHSTDHGRVIGIWENVLHHGADPTGVADSQPAFQAAVDTGRDVFVPRGTYKFADGATVGMVNNNRVVGGGGVFISVKDAYAFTRKPGHTYDGGMRVENLTVNVRTGSTSGGAVYFESVSDVLVKDVYASSIATCLTPPIWLSGTVGSTVIHCLAQGATADGIRLDSLGAGLSFCNANFIYRSRAASIQGATNAGISLSGSGCTIRDCIVESNRGYGINLGNSGSCVVEGVWLEDNSNHNLVSTGGSTIQIINSKFHYNHGDIGTAEHISLTGSVNGRHHHRIEGNHFQDGSSSGTSIHIGPNVEFTSVLFNRGAFFGPTANIVDEGSYSIIVGNDNGSLHNDDFTFGTGYYVGNWRQKASAAGVAVGGNPADPHAMWSVSDSTNDNYVMIGTRGYLIQRTGSTLTSSDELQTKSFVLYFDPADSKIKARVRDQTGAYSTHTLTN